MERTKRKLVALASVLCAAACQATLENTAPQDARTIVDARIDSGFDSRAGDATADDAARDSAQSDATLDSSAHVDAGIDASCTPQCSGRACGDNGCDGSCGSCSGAQTCNANGQCEEPQSGCQRPTRWPRPTWFDRLNIPASAGRYCPGQSVRCANGAPAIVRDHQGIYWLETFENVQSCRGNNDYSGAEFAPGAPSGGFRPPYWAGEGDGYGPNDYWFFADADPRQGWTPEAHVPPTYADNQAIGCRSNDEDVIQGRASPSELRLINGGVVVAHETSGVMWVEVFGESSHNPNEPWCVSLSSRCPSGDVGQCFPRGQGSYRPGGWLSAGGVAPKTSTQFTSASTRP